MPMPFWPATDYDRIIDLFEAVRPNISAPSTNYDRLYDPDVSFTPPDESTDPKNPAMFATWGFDSHVPEETMDPDTAGSRRIILSIAFWTQRKGTSGIVSGTARLLGAEFFRELQSASVANLVFIPQTMRWTEPPGRPDPDWMESAMTFELHSK
jgi:hypothetical protein